MEQESLRVSGAGRSSYLMPRVCYCLLGGLSPRNGEGRGAGAEGLGVWDVFKYFQHVGR